MNLAVSFTGRDIAIGLALTWTLAFEEQFYLLWPLFLIRWMNAPRVGCVALGLSFLVGLGWPWIDLCKRHFVPTPGRGYSLSSAQPCCSSTSGRCLDGGQCA